MTYATIMVNMQLGRSNAGLLQLASTLAKQFGASVTGIAARQPMQILYTDGCYVSPELIDGDREEIAKEMRAAQAEFRGAIELPRADLEWREAVTYEPPCDFVAREARRADLVLSGMPSAHSADVTRVATGDLVMQTGRPVLVVPEMAGGATLKRIVIGWKETREARRAAGDAMPLLLAASRVTVIQIAAEDELEEVRRSLADVAGWLGRHGASVETVAAASTGDDGHTLNTLAVGHGADLIVAGAYGHSRLREWALGGVTRDLLLRGDRCTLLSH